VHQGQVGRQLVRVGGQGLLQALGGGVDVAFGQGQGGQAELIGRTVRRQFDGALVGGARSGDIAGALGAQAEQVLGVGVFGLGGHGGAGGGEGGGGVAAAQRLGDLGKHGEVFRLERKAAL
jgi:hypothetical protein